MPQYVVQCFSSPLLLLTISRWKHCYCTRFRAWFTIEGFTCGLRVRQGTCLGAMKAVELASAYEVQLRVNFS